MKNLIIKLILTLLIYLPIEGIACTSAVITGKVTTDGRPLLWKHRDTGE